MVRHGSEDGRPIKRTAKISPSPLKTQNGSNPNPNPHFSPSLPRSNLPASERVESAAIMAATAFQRGVARVRRQAPSGFHLRRLGGGTREGRQAVPWRWRSSEAAEPEGSCQAGASRPRRGTVRRGLQGGAHMEVNQDDRDGEMARARRGTRGRRSSPCGDDGDAFFPAKPVRRC
uniref:Uncharacterized protein n=1 Tax=Oryza sativa subsp. japonica TaxID=39947 RepID=Q6YYU3_ORYSJ|nr:hypothetical protein [Oryza sativa Japonica Group]BAD34054.1 hypothetical protein [Oryza sativa Japonica Group]